MQFVHYGILYHGVNTVERFTMHFPIVSYDLRCLAHLFVLTVNHYSLTSPFFVYFIMISCQFSQPVVLMCITLFSSFFNIYVPFFLFFFFPTSIQWPHWFAFLCTTGNISINCYRKLIEIYDYIISYHVAYINQGQTHGLIEGLINMYHFLLLVHVGSGISSFGS